MKGTHGPHIYCNSDLPANACRSLPSLSWLQPHRPALVLFVLPRTPLSLQVTTPPLGPPNSPATATPTPCINTLEPPQHALFAPWQTNTQCAVYNTTKLITWGTWDTVPIAGPECAVMRHTQRPLQNAYHILNSVHCVGKHSAMELSNIGFGMRCVPTQKRTNGGIPHTVQGIEPVCIICNHYGRQSTYKATIFINTTWEAQKNCFASEFQVQGSDSWMQVLIHAHGCHAVPTISPDHVAAVQIQEEKHAATPQHLSLHTPCPARYCGLSVNY